MRNLTVLIAAVLLFVVACGGGDESSLADGEASPEEADEAGSDDPAGGGSICRLLTDEEVERSLGGPLLDRVGADFEEGGHCHYTGASGANAYLGITRDTGDFESELAFDGSLDFHEAADEPTVVEGLGDKAFFISD